jgi:3-isopropylmalate/(R)-2-methylmalate dehydratase small subunit
VEALGLIEGVAAPLLRPNIDTDAIIPSREITSPGREGYGEKLFAAWRYEGPERRENPDFVLNRAPFRQACILIAGANFGCGSSREMAVWALRQFGLRCVIAPSFGAIFRANCLRNALLPVELPAPTVAALGAAAASGGLRLRVDLVACEVVDAGGRRHAFAIDAAEREMLLSGQDAIDRTWQWRAQIEAFEAADRDRRPWIWALP